MKRIDEIVRMCPPTEVIADIGCDHGMTAAELCKSCGRVIASDVSAPSLEKARRLASAYPLECRLGDGFSPYAPGELDAAVISGMGAMLIINIIDAGREALSNISYLTLSPNNYPDRLRVYLTENGWKIEEEILVEDAGKYYFIMRVCPGADAPYTKLELELGRAPVASRELAAYARRRLCTLRRIAAVGGRADYELIDDLDEWLEKAREQ